MRYEVERIFTDWAFNVPGTSHLESGMHRLDRTAARGRVPDHVGAHPVPAGRLGSNVFGT